MTIAEILKDPGKLSLITPESTRDPGGDAPVVRELTRHDFTTSLPE